MATRFSRNNIPYIIMSLECLSSAKELKIILLVPLNNLIERFFFYFFVKILRYGHHFSYFSAPSETSCSNHSQRMLFLFNYLLFFTPVGN